MKISGFTFVHNAIAGGYPILEAIRAVQPFVDEIVVVDAGSTDGTGELVKSLSFPVRIVSAEWGDQAGETLARLHAMNESCEGEVIVHFEADEVWDGFLLSDAVSEVKKGNHDVAVHRIQVEQNFQRIRWYPHPVHRVFPRGSVRKVGETTDRKADAILLSPERGLLWDCTNCFRDCWWKRLDQQSQLRGGEPLNNLAVAEHANLEQRMGAGFLTQPHWTWTTTPLALPPILRPLVGQTSYGEWR